MGSLEIKEQQSAATISLAPRNASEMLASPPVALRCSHSLHLGVSRARNPQLLLPVLPACRINGIGPPKRKPTVGRSSESKGREDVL